MDWFLYDSGLRHERVKYVLRFEGVANVLTCSAVSKLSLMLFCVILASPKEDRRASSLLVLTIFLVLRSGFPFFSNLCNFFLQIRVIMCHNI